MGGTPHTRQEGSRDISGWGVGFGLCREEDSPTGHTARAELLSARCHGPHWGAGSLSRLSVFQACYRGRVRGSGGSCDSSASLASTCRRAFLGLLTALLRASASPFCKMWFPQGCQEMTQCYSRGSCQVSKPTGPS